MALVEPAEGGQNDNTKNIQELAEEVINNMEIKKRDNGRAFVALKSHDIQWQVDLCREAHPSGMLPNDFVYDEIYNSLNIIIDLWTECNGVEEIREKALENGHIEGEIYNSDLLAWVSDNLQFSEYVDQALKDHRALNFFEALSIGNQLFKEEVFHSVLKSLEDQFNNQGA